MYNSDSINYEEALDVAVIAAHEAGIKIIENLGNIGFSMKEEAGRSDLVVVTELDREIQSDIVAKLHNWNPNIPVIGEEGTRGNLDDQEVVWHVDPVDGTRWLIRGLPFCTSMIALSIGGKVMTSVIEHPSEHDTYTAIRGVGAFRNGESISVSNRSLANAVVSFEYRPEDIEALGLHAHLRGIADATFQTLNNGYELAMVASGKIDAKVTRRPYGKAWDFAAGTLLVAEAGGFVKNHGQNDYRDGDPNFFAGSKIVYEELLRDAAFSRLLSTSLMP